MDCRQVDVSEMVSKMQGSAADLAKKAMIEIHNTFQSLPSEAGQLQPRLLLQIHDELLFEVPGPPLQPRVTLCWVDLCEAMMSAAFQQWG